MFVKIVIGVHAGPLTTVIKTCLSFLQKTLKVARVVPVKKRLVVLKSSYRLIAISPIISKIV